MPRPAEVRGDPVGERLLLVHGVRPRAYARGPTPLPGHVRGQEPGAGAGLRPRRVPRPAGREGHQGRRGRLRRRHGRGGPGQGTELLAGVRRVLAPGGRFVAVTPNPACYAVLSHDFWRDPTHVRFYDLPLLEFLCRQAGLTVESTGTNPANHPGPPPEYLVPEPLVHPPVGDLVERAMGK